MLRCTAPGGGPWKTCELSLCEQRITRRRLQDGGCTPITISCDFDQAGYAYCDAAGWVEMDTDYEVSSTAIKADGVRKSNTGLGNLTPYKLPFYP